MAPVAQSTKERDILSEIAQTWAILAEQAEQLEQFNADKNRSGREDRTQEQIWADAVANEFERLPDEPASANNDALIRFERANYKWH